MTTPDDPVYRLEARLDRIEQHLARISAAVAPVRTLPDTLAIATDAFDAWAEEQQRRGVDLDGHAAHAVALSLTLTDPRVAADLERLIALLPKLLPVAELAATFEPTTAMAFDMADELVRSLDARGIDVEARIRQVIGLVERVTEPAFHQHLEALLDTAPALAAATRTGELFGHAVDDVVAAPPPPVGLVGLVRALGNPDVQRAVGFAIALAERIGRRLPSSAVPASRS